MKSYDLNKWDVDIYNYEYNNYSGVGLNEFSPDGIYTLKLADTVKSVDCYVQNFSNKKYSHFLVCFNGAVSRSSSSAPYFSGLGISVDLNMPIISISDPSLALDSSLQLSWYAGLDGWVNLPQDLAVIIEVIGKNLGLKPLLFGGSGGGFAAINIASYFKSEADVFAWNPQTSISDYGDSFVNNYIEKAFQDLSPVSNYEKLNSLGVSHDLKARAIPDYINLYYIQNFQDAHYRIHAKPFLEANGFSVFDTASNGNINFILANYAGGHSPISREAVNKIIILLRSNIENKMEFIPDLKSLYTKNWGVDSFIVNCKVLGGRVFAAIIMDEFLEGCSFAFYLVKNGEKLRVTNYSNSNYYFFEYDDDLSGCEVVGFVRNSLGDKLFKRVNC